MIVTRCFKADTTWLGQADVFTNFSLDVAPGEHVALVGASGEGKSVLLALMAGLVNPLEGQIAFPGLHGESRRPDIGWLDQHPHVFSATVAQNISLGRPEVDRTAVEKAIAIAKLGNVSQARPHTPLGEQGRGMSAGEIRRLGLARLATDVGMQLVLADEPTANLDRLTAEETIEALLCVARARTLIVATHDPALITRMDRVIRLGDTQE